MTALVRIIMMARVIDNVMVRVTMMTRVSYYDGWG